MPHSNGYCYNFGPYKFDLANGILTRESAVISLPPKAIEILEVLVKNAGQLIEKDQLMKLVWPDTFVEEANLSQNVFMLRRALGDRRLSPTYIETVTRRGYRFVCPVTRVSCNEGSTDESQMTRRDRDAAMTGLAVLPFANETGDENLEYLADGITETIINNLSRLSRLRVMSRSSVFRYRGRQLDPTEIGQLLGIDALLVGKVALKPSGLVISAELVDAANGWQLWGETFDCKTGDILEIQDEIARRLTAALKLKLTGDEEKKLTTRYTENSEAYKAYLEGRYHWSRYTKASIEKAIVHFRRAIELDQNYALAYSGIVDCYLRLVTNYLPPDLSEVERRTSLCIPETYEGDTENKVLLRYHWDWKGVERELRRGNDIKLGYPKAFQWHSAYLSIERYVRDQTRTSVNLRVPVEIASSLTQEEQLQVYCLIAREQIDGGNYEAACTLLSNWWQFGEWPRIDGLSLPSSADLLFTSGTLAGCVASTRQIPKGQKHAEALLSGSIALFQHLGSSVCTAEGRIELALCYYRQGLFDLGRSTLTLTIATLDDSESDLGGLALIRLASLERHAGRLQDALANLEKAEPNATNAGPWIRARFNLELATSYKELYSSDSSLVMYSERAIEQYRLALFEFEAIGNHRMSGIVHNNAGFLLLILGRLEEVELHLFKALRIFQELDDRVRGAQVKDTLSRYYLATGNLQEAEELVDDAVKTLENGDEDSLFAETLTTKGVVLCRLQRFKEARACLEIAERVAERCGDVEGAGRALVIILEELRPHIESHETRRFEDRGFKLMESSVGTALRLKLQRLLGLHAENE